MNGLYFQATWATSLSVITEPRETGYSHIKTDGMCNSNRLLSAKISLNIHESVFQNFLGVRKVHLKIVKNGPLLQDKAVLEPRVSAAFAITYFCNHCNIRFENTSKYVDTLTLFSKNLNQKSLTPR